jgi:hypothetical protein
MKMSQYYESATLELQEALNDKSLIVEYNERTKQYEVLQRHQSGCNGEYHTVVTAFDEWDGRAILALRAGSPDQWTPEKVIAKLKENRYKVDKKTAEQTQDFQNQFKKMIIQMAKEPKYFYTKVGV